MSVLPGHYPITQLALNLGFRTKNTNGFIERSMPIGFNFSQLKSFDDWESSTDGHMRNKQALMNTNAEHKYIDELTEHLN